MTQSEVVQQAVDAMNLAGAEIERLREALIKVRGEVAATKGYEPNGAVLIKLDMIDGYARAALTDGGSDAG